MSFHNYSCLAFRSNVAHLTTTHLYGGIKTGLGKRQPSENIRTVGSTDLLKDRKYNLATVNNLQ